MIAIPIPIGFACGAALAAAVLRLLLQPRRRRVERTLGIGWKCARCGEVAKRGDHHGRTACTFTRDKAVITLFHIDTSKPPRVDAAFGHGVVGVVYGYDWIEDTDGVVRPYKARRR